MGAKRRNSAAPEWPNGKKSDNRRSKEAKDEFDLINVYFREMNTREMLEEQEVEAEEKRITAESKRARRKKNRLTPPRAEQP